MNQLPFRLLLHAALVILTWSQTSCNDQLLPELTFSLSGRNLNFPSEEIRILYEYNSSYVPRNILATRFQIFDNLAIVAMPRFKSGIPVTLGIASLNEDADDREPVILPFPNWLIQTEGDCTGFQSVTDLAMDERREVVWALDVGIVNMLEESPVMRCPAKVLEINVRSGKVVKIIDLSELVNEDSQLQYLIVDQALDGQVFLYISDASSRAVIVCNTTNDTGFRVILPQAVSRGYSNKDVLYLLLAKKSCGTTELYFTYLNSNRLYNIKVENLRTGNIKGCIVDAGIKKNRIVLLGTDSGAGIFFRYKGQSDVYMWNAETLFRPENFMLVQRGNECLLPTQVAPGYKRLVWVIESNFHDYIKNTVSCTGASVSLHPLVSSVATCS